MEFKNIFYFPNEFNTILETLQYIFCRIIYTENICPLLNEIYLIPNDLNKRHVFFKVQQDYIYAPIPANWDISFKIKKSKYKNCPNEFDHKLIKLINDLINILEIRKNDLNFNKLLNLFLQINQEYNFNCKFCNYIYKEKKELGLQDIFIDRIYISPRESDLNQVKESLEFHIRYSEIISNQIRSFDLKKIFFDILFNEYYLYKKDYENALINNEPILNLYNNFKNNITNQVVKIIPFLSFKNIYFDKWFKSIFLFELDLQKNVNKKFKTKLYYSTKIMLLLYYLFEESNNNNMDEKCIIFKENKQIIKKINLEKMYEYHPIIRGNCL